MDHLKFVAPATMRFGLKSLEFGCRLQISGCGFDADSFLKECAFSEEIDFIGKIKLPSARRQKIVEKNPAILDDLYIFDMTNLVIRISIAFEFYPQVADAIRFLKKYRDNLSRLRTDSHVDTMLMRFSCTDDNAEIEFPVELLQLVSELGIEGVMFGKPA